MSVTKKDIITAVAIFIFTIIYFILSSREVYPSKAQFIHIYYPLGLMLGAILIVLLNKFFIGSSIRYVIISTISMTLCLITFTYVADYLYRPILYNYYKRQPNSTLIGLANYSRMKGNYITIHKEMLKEGTFARSIAEGYSNSEGNRSEVYNTPLTYVVNDMFVIFDWDTAKVIKKEKKDIILKEAYNYLVKELNISQELESYYTNGCHICMTVAGKYYYVIVYAEKGDFAYSVYFY